MEILLTLIQIPILIVLIKYIRTLHSNTLFVNYYYFLLSIKVTAGLILGYLYFSYYKYGDTLNFLETCEFLSGYSANNFIGYLKFILLGETNSELLSNGVFAAQPRTFLFIRVVSPFFIFTGSNYWILSIYLSLFSFLGFWILSNTILKIYKLNSLAVLISFFITPTVVFWSSGFMKESLIMGMMCWLISILLEYVHQETFSLKRVFFVLFFSYVLLIVKFYYFGALAVTFIPYCIVIYLRNHNSFIERSTKNQIVSYVLLILVMVFLASSIHPLLNISKLSNVVYQNYIATLDSPDGGSMYTFEGLSSSPKSFIKYIPDALIKGVFGPFIWNCKKMISLMSGLENMVILILFIPFAYYNFRFKKIFNLKLIELSVLIYVVTLAIFMAFSSPNWGSLVRYKVGYLPFFMLLLLNTNPLIFFLEKKLNFSISEDKVE